MSNGPRHTLTKRLSHFVAKNQAARATVWHFVLVLFGSHSIPRIADLMKPRVPLALRLELETTLRLPVLFWTLLLDSVSALARRPVTNSFG